MTIDRDTILRRVRGLLAKAESTDSPHERDALTAKAMTLIDQHRIEQAELHQGTNLGRTTYPLAATAKYLRPSLQLLGAVARYYGVVVLVPATGNSRMPELVGDTDDILMTVLLFESLLIQRDIEVLASPMPPYVNVNKFRSSAAMAYAVRIRERLTDLAAARQTAATTGTEIELASRLDQVREALGNPDHRHTNKRTHDPAGVQAGFEAADRADLGQDRLPDATNGPRALTT